MLFKPWHKAFAMKSMFTWHFYYLSFFIFERFQFFFGYISDWWKANKAFSFVIFKFKNVSSFQSFNCFFRCWRRSVGIWIILHYLLYYILNILVSTDHTSSTYSGQHLKQSDWYTCDLDWTLQVISSSPYMSNQIRKHNISQDRLPVLSRNLVTLSRYQICNSSNVHIIKLKWCLHQATSDSDLSSYELCIPELRIIGSYPC